MNAWLTFAHKLCSPCVYLWEIVCGYICTQLLAALSLNDTKQTYY